MPIPNRQLAAIMFSDIVGYTALMGKDSDKALQLVRQNRQLQKPLVESHRGTWIKEMGDGAMAQFSSALDAVKCAIAIQRASRADFDAELRIGIHLGDITIENNDVYGDGVNIAARLESIADPGGIYISESVEKAIRGQSDIQAKYLGEVRLKNVDYGVRTYAIQGVGLPVPDVKRNEDISGKFLAEIARRGVVRAGLMYILVSLAIFFILPIISSWIDLPDAIDTFLTVALIAGFPVAVLLAWRYERSPEGFVRTDSATSWQNPLKAKQRKPFTGIGVTLTLVVVILIIQVYNKSKIDEPSDGNEVSLAIIPFHNNSGNDELSHYGIGMASEIRSKLSYSKRFEFISAMQATLGYANTVATPMEIGNKLKVDYILTGMYQVDDERIKVDVELVDAQTGRGIWDLSFNELFADIFGIQSRIAGEVMKGFSFDGEAEMETSTKNLAAYSMYLKGIEITQDNELIEQSMDLSIDNFKSAIELDSGFIDAWVKLIDMETAQIWFESSTLKKEKFRTITKAHVDEFKNRFPDSWKIDLVEGLYAYHGNQDYEQGKKLFQKVLLHDPENFEANLNLAAICNRNLRPVDAIHHFQKAIRQNPNSYVAWGNLAFVFLDMGDYDGARKIIQNARLMGYELPDHFAFYYYEGIEAPQETLSNVEYQFINEYIQDDFNELLMLTNQLQSSFFLKNSFKAIAHHGLENYDSARHYAKKVVQFAENNEITRPYYTLLPGILNDKEMSLKFVREQIERFKHLGDYSQVCELYYWQISSLCLLGEYREATTKLLELNKNYPQWGDFGRLYNSPKFDRIKEEYPPFLEALNNLKLPPKIDLVELGLF